MYSSFSVVHGKKITDSLLVVDLHTREVTRADLEEADLDAESDDNGPGNDGSHGTKINDGRIEILTNVWSHLSGVLLRDLASGDAEKVLGGQRVITWKSWEQENNGNRTNSVEVKGLIEVKPGLCLLVTHDYPGDYKLALETVAWSGEKLPRALETWLEWLTDN